MSAAPVYAIVIAWVAMDGVRLTGRYLEALHLMRAMPPLPARMIP